MVVLAFPFPFGRLLTMDAIAAASARLERAADLPITGALLIEVAQWARMIASRGSKQRSRGPTARRQQGRGAIPCPTPADAGERIAAQGAPGGPQKAISERIGSA